MAKDDERLARQQAEKDLQELLRLVPELKRTVPGLERAAIVSSDNIDSMKEEFGAGERTLFTVVIGMRGCFSRNEARRGAKARRKLCAKYPHGFFYPSLAGYDDDPREIWEFEDACHYVRQWARFAGMDDLETALRYCKEAPGALGFLSACGVFGEEKRRLSLAATKPTSQQ